MNDWPETCESLILRIKDPADAAAWSAFLAIYRPVVVRLACSRGIQNADADDLAQRVFLSISRSVKNWTATQGGPPFRAWLYRIAQNEILKAISRTKVDAATGSSSVREMLGEVPEREPNITTQLLHEARMEAFRWAADEIMHEFKAATWTMFWQSTVDGQPIAEVAIAHGRTKGAVYLSRYRVMKRLKEKLNEVSDAWSGY